MGPIPPPFPSGKGAGRLMVLLVFKSMVVSRGIGFSPPAPVWGLGDIVPEAQWSGRQETGLFATSPLRQAQCGA